jgi:hypothetical protein
MLLSRENDANKSGIFPVYNSTFSLLSHRCLFVFDNCKLNKGSLALQAQSFPQVIAMMKKLVVCAIPKAKGEYVWQLLKNQLRRQPAR